MNFTQTQLLFYPPLQRNSLPSQSDSIPQFHLNSINQHSIQYSQTHQPAPDKRISQSFEHDGFYLQMDQHPLQGLFEKLSIAHDILQYKPQTPGRSLLAQQISWVYEDLSQSPTNLSSFTPIKEKVESAYAEFYHEEFKLDQFLDAQQIVQRCIGWDWSDIRELLSYNVDIQKILHSTTPLAYIPYTLHPIQEFGLLAWNRYKKAKHSVSKVVAEKVVCVLREALGDVQVVGGLRRGKNVVGFVDVVVPWDITEDPILKVLEKLRGVVDDKLYVQLGGRRFVGVAMDFGVIVDVKVAGIEEIPWMLLYYTGSRQFVERCVLNVENEMKKDVKSEREVFEVL